MDLKRLGLKIKDRREELGWTQEDLVGNSGVARGALQELEKGRGNPTISTLDALAQALDWTVAELYIDPDKPSTKSTKPIGEMDEDQFFQRMRNLLMEKGPFRGAEKSNPKRERWFPPTLARHKTKKGGHA